MKKLTNKQRCAKCIHKIVCTSKKTVEKTEGLEWYFGRCRYYKPEPKEKKEQGATK